MKVLTKFYLNQKQKDRNR